jgi:ribosomal protein S18 acetylase RimI-like enzyme
MDLNLPEAASLARLTFAPLPSDTVPMTADDVTIRRARPQDAGEVAEVHLRSRRAAEKAGLIPPSVHTDDEIRLWVTEHLMKACDVWIALSGRKTVAMMALEGDLLDQLYVIPDRQSRGVGTTMLKLAKVLRPSGLRLFTFLSNTPARRFYEAHNFFAVDFNDGSRNEERAPDVLYEWSPARAASPQAR